MSRHVFRRVQAGVPSVLLGTLFNVLDAVSTGLLVFPSTGTAFAGLQNRAMSMYILSTILSQVALTCGGSLFPGALGAMLIEVLPFLRGVASDIRDALGDDSDSVVPTVMVAYALSSVLTGIVFLLLGALGLGRLISYFPPTVLTGAIGGIGVALFILGLGLPLPSDVTLTLANAGQVLFSRDHVGVLLASLLPIIFLCYSVRSAWLSKLTRGAVEHPYYVPLFLLSIGLFFWVIVAGVGIARLGGVAGLAADNWLFETPASSAEGGVRGFVDAINYWQLFDFGKVRMSALGNAATNLVLLVVIGVLNLPVYVPALALALDVPFSMNHELIGHGASNILAGLCGTVPNILQLSYSVFFTRAGGGRGEAAVVIAWTVLLFFTSSYILRYIPTVLASGLVFFLGIELTMEAVWESTKYLIWSEYLVVIATLLACTFLGFAPGIGVGIAAAVVVYTGWGCFDLRARSLKLTGRDDGLRYSSIPATAPEEMGASICQQPLSADLHHHQTMPPLDGQAASRISVVKLDGYFFFGIIASFNSEIDACNRVATGGSGTADLGLHQYIIIDLTSTYRVETAAAQLIKSKIRDAKETTLVLAGLSPSSGTAADIRRAGITLDFETSRLSGAAFSKGSGDEDLKVFENCAMALAWCRNELERQASEYTVTGPAAVNDEEDSRRLFVAVFGSKLSQQPLLDTHDRSLALSQDNRPVKIRVLHPDSHSPLLRPVLSRNARSMLCVVSGTLQLPAQNSLCVLNCGSTTATTTPPARYNRASLRDAVAISARRLPVLTRNLLLSRFRRSHYGTTRGRGDLSPSDSDETDVDKPVAVPSAGPGCVILCRGDSVEPPSMATAKGQEMFLSTKEKPRVEAFQVRDWPYGAEMLRADGPAVVVEIEVPMEDLPLQSSRTACEDIIGEVVASFLSITAHLGSNGTYSNASVGFARKS